MPLTTLSHYTCSVPRPLHIHSPNAKSNRITALSLHTPPATASSSNNLHRKLAKLAASSLFFIGISSASATTAFAHPPPLSAPTSAVVENHNEGDLTEGEHDTIENLGKKEIEAAIKSWNSKTSALTVPLRIVALRGSIPPSWVKDFIKSQGKKAKFSSTFRESLEGIFTDLCKISESGKKKPTSALAADLVSIGDSWLNFAISKGLIEPLQGIENEDWFSGLSDKWKVYLRRNCEGQLDPEGKIWAAPYRWGTMVIAYKKSKFQKHNFAPIEDWADLWRPELAGRISMINSPREVVGMTLKYMGASYNTKNIDLEVAGGTTAVEENLVSLAKQVRLFDSTNYLKAFGVGDVWVAVGWSADVLPAIKRMSNVAVIIPKSGASLWADLWAIPAASRVHTERIGDRFRGPSPLIYQWIEFCLQPARVLPFKQQVLPGASPSSLESISIEEPEMLMSSRPKLETNLISGVPPPGILERCEFLEPLSDVALSDYQRLIGNIQVADSNLWHKIQHFILHMLALRG